MFDGKAFGQEIVEIVKAHLAASLDGVFKRLNELEQRVPERGEKGEVGAQGLVGPPGESGPPGEKGFPGFDGKPGPEGPAGLKGEPGEPGPPGEAGRDGRDGQPGRDGKDGIPGEGGLDGKDGADGRHGIDGKDGFSLDDFQVSSEDGGRTMIFAFSREGVEAKRSEVKTDIVLYRGVYSEGATYAKGDCVTFGGSSFIAKADTMTKPETGGSDWQLSVKRGRDGKEGKAGEKGEAGKEGRAGRDLTQVGSDGRKW